MRRIRSVICTGVLALIPALLSIQCGGSDSLDKESEPTRNPEPNRVRISATAADHAGIKVETVRSHVISDTVRTTGVVNPDQDSISRIRPLSRGRIEKVFVGLGDYVHAESPLAEYDNIELGMTVGEYRNQWAELQ
jgi:multidrug efflux pump subunit AcrA (membrane-fusion protein)